MRSHALAGTLATAAVWLLPVHAASGMPLVERLVLTAILVVTPLGLDRILDGEAAWTRHAWWPAAACALASLYVAPGKLAAALAVPWVLYAAALALLLGLRRLKNLKDLPGLLVDAGVAQLVVGAAWLVLSRLGGTQLGYDAATVALTAIHFHYAGFAAALIAGRVGRLELGRLRIVYRPAALVLATGPMWVALGIVVDDRLQVVSALLLAASVLVVGGLLGFRAAPWAWRAGARASASIFGFAGLLLVVTMGLATAFALTEFTGHPILSIPEMALTHGLGNALGFGLLGTLAFRLAPKL